MKQIETVNKLIHAIETKKWIKVSQLLYDGFAYSGAMPEHVGKDMFIVYHRVLLAAFPDWKYNLSSLRLEKNIVKGTIQVTGTHTKELKLSIFGLPNVRATGKKISFPTEEFEVLVEENLIIDITFQPPFQLSLSRILEQLDVKVPEVAVLSAL